MMNTKELKNATGEQKTIELDNPDIRNTTVSLELPADLQAATGQQRAECAVVTLKHPSKKN